MPARLRKPKPLAIRMVASSQTGPLAKLDWQPFSAGLQKALFRRPPFTDLTGHWAKDAINQAYAKKYLTGYPDGGFRSDAPITRAEAGVMVNSFLAVSPCWPQKKPTTTFKYLLMSHWAYDQVMACHQ